ncbi:DUF4917 family protein [Pseudomonas benzopyrenica]|uniref:DUF4917 family protein n=1 Tax=Pseudomonas benzopyrenica TaxID=2993566 RepID=A0ABZ2FYW2_9PSED
MTDDKLENWNELSREIAHNKILLGNGSSRAIWDNFNYPTLFEEALRLKENPLSDADARIFDLIKTTNFEDALFTLSQALKVNSILELPTDGLADRYENIRQALVSAVKSVHISWTQCDPVLDHFASSLLQYKQGVFTTNYDLILYWAVMKRPWILKDLFFSDLTFDPYNTNVWEGGTPIYYLHGGLHLYTNSRGLTKKRSRSENPENNLLTIGDNRHPPLFISEGDSAGKYQQIRKSTYLFHCLSKLLEKKPNEEVHLCIFGHGLSAQDSHISAKLALSDFDTISISLRKQDSHSLIETKTHYERIFRLYKAQGKLRFFDAATHPLGDPDISRAPSK